MDCVICHQPAELEFEGVPVCKDCFSLQGSTCSGSLYRLVQEKRKKDAGGGEKEKPGKAVGQGIMVEPGKPAKPDTPDTR